MLCLRSPSRTEGPEDRPTRTRFRERREINPAPLFYGSSAGGASVIIGTRTPSLSPRKRRRLCEHRLVVQGKAALPERFDCIADEVAVMAIFVAEVAHDEAREAVLL